MFLESDAVGVLLEVLRKSTESPKTIAAAFDALANLAPSTAWRQAAADVVADEALKVLRGPLSVHDDVVKSACRCLSNACSNNQRLSAKVCNAGGLQLFVAAMQRYPACERLQLGACTALHCLADADSTGWRWKSDAGRAGLTAALAAMAAFPDAPTLQQNGCLALGSLIRDTEALQVHIVKLGGVAAIVKALTTHAADAGIAETACLALGNISPCFTPPHVTGRAAAAAHDAVLRALRAHAGHLLTQRHGLSALACVLQHEAVRECAEPSLDVILAAMKTFRSDLHVQSNACMAICAGAFIEDHFRTFAGRAGAVQAVVRVMRTCAAPVPNPAVISSQHLFDTSSNAAYWARLALLALLQNESGFPNQLKAVHAGALSLLQTQLSEPHARELVHVLEKRAAEHEGQQRGGCSECAAMRASGKMCGLAGCTVRWRANGSSLQLCAGCHVAAYCCREHQKEAWRASHKAECGKAARR